MSRYWDQVESYAQPDVGTLKRRVSETTKREKKKGNALSPVIISGRQITTTWWGKAWCENLEQYADFASRLERGKRYVRSGTVVDLKIAKGRVTARVQGRRKTPYKVEIRISPIDEEKCERIMEACGNRISSLENLMAGNIPEELKSLFVGKEGLFPKPTELSFMCSCPDWAILCKHVAAVLYGIGNRFDDNPLLFFELRGIDVDRFISVTLESRVEKMVRNAEQLTSRCLDGIDMMAVFGI